MPNPGQIRSPLHSDASESGFETMGTDTETSGSGPETCRNGSETSGSGSDSDTIANEEQRLTEEVDIADDLRMGIVYCYCRCGYDIQSEMMRCNNEDCAIKWFHFECVGITRIPRGQWFCPTCKGLQGGRR